MKIPLVMNSKNPFDIELECPEIFLIMVNCQFMEIALIMNVNRNFFGYEW